MKNTLFLIAYLIIVACAPTPTPPTIPPTQDSHAIETTIASRIYATLTASAPPKATETLARPTEEIFYSLSPIDCDTKGKSEGANISLPYDNLVRNTESYLGSLVGYVGSVFQVAEQDNQNIVLLINLSDERNSNDILWLDYQGERLREGDTIKFYGRVLGRQQYTSLAGKQVIVPRLRTICSWIIFHSR